MQILFKVVFSVTIILLATVIGKKLPAAGGLVAVMPLTGVLAMIFMYLENSGDPTVMQAFTKGAFFGIFPTLLFFLVAFLCFKKHFSLSIVLFAGFGVWLAAAFVHQLMLK
jgi:uncharacterized membrane protein (GlpM family)